MESIYKLATTLFLLANPIGNSPAIVAMLKRFDFVRQKRIMLRESIFSFVIAVVFLFCGEYFLNLIEVKAYTLSLCSGTLLFFVAFEMIFPRHSDDVTVAAQKQEPFIVPIATPLITGPSTMTMIMIYASQYPNVRVLSAISLAWVGVVPVLLAAPYLQKILGKRGLTALEQLMGMLLAMIAVETAIGGVRTYIGAI